MKSWITTVCGILSGLSLVLSRTPGFESYSDMFTALAGIFAAGMGAAAKDFNVTGGTVDGAKKEG